MLKFVLLLLYICTPLLSAEKEGDNDYYRELSDNVKLFFDVLLTINENYVDTANIEDMMNEGINAMLATTDPYTVLLKDTELDHYNELSTGTYGGIGIYIGTSGPDKRLTVISPMDDTPASGVGLRAGDRIMFIDGTDTKGMSIKDASKYLRGKEGTKVVLKIKRIGSEELLKFSLTRKNINVLNIPFSAVMNNGIGYIKLTQFTATSYYNFVNEFEKLIFNGASSLIVDLRFNPGGLLQSAVKLCSVFLPENKMVVYTRGRGDNINSEYTTYLTPLDTEIPLVVLINGSSASASEIFAGSLQDHDRAVIIGEPTFGKGLVQQLFDVGNLKKRNLKMTVRKYYTASGRLIQKDDIFKDKEKNGSDTLFHKTLVNKRDVPSGMGIIPDILVKPVRIPEYIVSLKMNNYFNDFLYYFLEKEPGHVYEGYVDDKMLESFKSYLEKEGFNYKSKSEMLADSLLNRTKTEDHPEDVIKMIRKAVESFKTAARDDFEEYSEEIKKNLNTQFAVYHFGNEEKYRISNEFDPAVRKAVEILMDEDKYQTILGY